ncbi:MAG: oligopeptide transporter, OPT family [Sedimentisphaerales bacterium]|nr:oligopeptide transporter, OPT family [Sedimentisphaerales bacterium]
MNLEEKSLPEITLKAFVLGVVLSIVLAAANAYLGLRVGMTVSASIPAAVVSMGILRLWRKSNILENNIVQTAASAGESLAAGVIFTLPALVIMDYWPDFSGPRLVWVMIIAGFGGLLGVLFTIPLRRALIVEGKLKFPEGIATAEVLEAGEQGGKGVWTIAKAAVVGGLFRICSGVFGLWPGHFEIAARLRSTIAYFGSDLSPALLSVGYIVGLNIAVLIFLGGLANWLIAIPIFAGTHAWSIYPAGHANAGEAMTAVDWAHTIWSQQTRYIGVGGMLVGGLWTIVNLRKSIFSGISSGLKAYSNVIGEREQIPRTEKDMPMKWILILIAASVVPLFLLYQKFVGQVQVALPMAVTMLITGFLFSAVAGYMAGLVGSSNNPISGVTIATVLVSALLLLVLMGSSAEDGPPAAIIIGGVVCCAAAIAGDNMQDLKAGYIVKATPWKQQIMQMVGTLSAALVMAPIMMLLLNAYGFAGHSSAKDEPLIAAQASLMSSVANGVFGGGLPWTYVWIGMALAVGIVLLDLYLQKIKSSFRTPVLAVAIGFYLPFELSVPIFAGGLIHQALKSYGKRRSDKAEEIEGSSRSGLLFASGLITGEALMGILLAVPIVILAKKNISLPLWKMTGGSLLGIALLIAVACWLYKTAKE